MATKLIKLLLLFSIVATSTSLVDLICGVRKPDVTLYQMQDNERQLFVNNSSLNATATTFIIIHGWFQNSSGSNYNSMGRKLAVYGNVILVDYGRLALKPYIPCVYYIAKRVEKAVSSFIISATTAGKMTPGQVHIIGHSLGGQVAGNIGHHVFKGLGQKIHRITALDPAGPLYTFFFIPIPGLSLGPTDADIVDVLHTTLLMGSVGKIGTVDFYAMDELGLVTAQPSMRDKINPVYSHGLSQILFEESIDSCGIVGRGNFYSGESVTYGFHMPLNATGMYYLKTKSKSPYGMDRSACV